MHTSCYSKDNQFQCPTTKVLICTTKFCCKFNKQPLTDVLSFPLGVNYGYADGRSSHLKTLNICSHRAPLFDFLKHTESFRQSLLIAFRTIKAFWCRICRRIRFVCSLLPPIFNTICFQFAFLSPSISILPSLLDCNIWSHF